MKQPPRIAVTLFTEVHDDPLTFTDLFNARLSALVDLVHSLELYGNVQGWAVGTGHRIKDALYDELINTEHSKEFLTNLRDAERTCKMLVRIEQGTGIFQGKDEERLRREYREAFFDMVGYLVQAATGHLPREERLRMVKDSAVNRECQRLQDTLQQALFATLQGITLRHDALIYEKDNASAESA